MSIKRDFAIFSMLLLMIFNRPAEDNNGTSGTSKTGAIAGKVLMYGFTGVFFKDCPIIIKVNILRGLLSASKTGASMGLSEIKSFVDNTEKTITAAEENINNKEDDVNKSKLANDITSLKSLTNFKEIQSQITSLSSWSNLTSSKTTSKEESKTESNGKSTFDDKTPQKEDDNSDNNDKKLPTELRDLIANEAKQSVPSEIIENITFIMNYISHVELKTAKCSPAGKLIEFYKGNAEGSNDYEAKNVATELNLILSYCSKINAEK